MRKKHRDELFDLIRNIGLNQDDFALSLDTQKGQPLFDLFTKVFSVLPC